MVIGQPCPYVKAGRRFHQQLEVAGRSVLLHDQLGVCRRARDQPGFVAPLLSRLGASLALLEGARPALHRAIDSSRDYFR